MPTNLLNQTWKNFDSTELRLFLNNWIGGSGQYNNPSKNSIVFYLPLAGPSCKISLSFRHKKIVSIEPGPGFDATEWERISKEIEKSILTEPIKVGREYSFSSFRVSGSWRGERSGVQILPPENDAPRAPVEMAEHPFVLEFPIKESNFWPITNYRRMREHRNLTLLLNVLLMGRTNFYSSRPEHFWGYVPGGGDQYESKWIQKFFSGKLGKAVVDELSPLAGQKLDEMSPEEYYAKVGHDGKGLRVPLDLDQSICHYNLLSLLNREKFDRAMFWLDIAGRTWNFSSSASFAALVSAIESLTERAEVHQVKCPICLKEVKCMVCTKDVLHEVPGATRRFKDFLDLYAPGDPIATRRDEMYRLRSEILHGGELMQLDHAVAFGWNPLWENERELLDELWSLTRIVLRNWLKNPPAIDQ